MGARISACPDCGHEWRQRDARFCGSCGARLSDPAATPRSRTSSRFVGRALAIAVVIGLLATAATLDLALPVDNDPAVDLDEEPRVAPNPLSPDEAAELRAQADLDRLRCEPAGCELWRFSLAEFGMADVYAGVVPLDDGALLIRVDDHQGLGGGPLDGGEDDANGVLGARHRLAAIDPATGERRWERVFTSPLPHDWTPDLRLASGPHGALVLSGRSVTSLSHDGEVVWEWSASGSQDGDGELWGAHQLDDLLLFEGWRPDDSESQRFLVALDAETGQMRWETQARAAATFLDGTVVIVDADRRVHRLTPDTGETVWTSSLVRVDWVTRIGAWLLAITQDGQVQLLRDEDGAPAARVPGRLVAAPVAAGEDLLVITASPRSSGGGPADEASEHRLHHVAPDGSIAWSQSLGNLDLTAECCHVEVDDGVVTITSRNERWVFAISDGTIHEVGPRPDDPATDAPWMPWFEVEPGVEVRWSSRFDSLRIRTAAGEGMVRGSGHIDVVSFAPLIVADGDDVLGVQVPEDG